MQGKEGKAKTFCPEMDQNSAGNGILNWYREISGKKLNSWIFNYTNWKIIPASNIVLEIGLMFIYFNILLSFRVFSISWIFFLYLYPFEKLFLFKFYTYILIWVKWIFLAFYNFFRFNKLSRLTLLWII